MNVIGLATAEIQRMADVCRGADPTTPVPTCPDWDLAALIRHTGSVHRWAATMVERRSPERLRRADLDLGVPDDPAALPDWLAAGATFVSERFEAADPAAEMWAWGWPKNAGFWPRRMLHETGIHRADAELALGIDPTFAPEVAADGIDELLDNLPHAAYFAQNVASLRRRVDSNEAIGLHATDIDDAWQLYLTTEGFQWTRHADYAADASDCEVVVAAPVTDLLLLLYRRRALDDVDATGDRSLVEHWLANAAL